MVRYVLIVLCLGILAMGGTAANAALITLNATPTDSTLDLTAVGTSDWVMPWGAGGGDAGYLARMANPDGSAVGILQPWIAHGFAGGWGQGSNSGGPTVCSWTNGTATQATNAGTARYIADYQYHARSGVNFALSGSNTETLTFIGGLGAAGPVTAWLTDASNHVVPGSQSITTAAGGWSKFTATFTGDSTMTAHVMIGDDNATYGGAGYFQTAALSTAPEPATMALLAVGGVGAMLRRRRN